MKDTKNVFFESIVIVDDDKDIRDSISEYLNMAGYRAVSYDGAGALLRSPHLRVSACIVMDVMLGGEIDGIDLIRSVREVSSTTPVVIMTAHGDITMAIRALRAGAVDFLEKPFTMQRLTAVLADLMERQRTVLEARQRVDRLTPREHEVMNALVQGLSNKEVAIEIGISPRTIEVHRASIMVKLQARSLADIVRLSILVGGVGGTGKS